MAIKTFLLFILIDVAVATYYWSNNDNNIVDNGGSLDVPSGCQCSCDRPQPRPEPRRTISDVLPAISRRRRRRKKERRYDHNIEPRINHVIEPRVTRRDPILSNDRIDRGSRGISVGDAIPESTGFGRQSFDNGFDNRFDTGFMDNGFDNGNDIGSNFAGGVGGFPVETNGDVGLVGLAPDGAGGVGDNGIRDRFNGDGFASIGGIREGSSGYGRHQGKYSRSYKRRRNRY